MDQTIKVVGIAGSLRKDSVNRKLLRVALSLLPEDVVYEEIDFSEVPLFNEDIELDTQPAVAAIRKQLEDADAIIIATPEYNYGMPGVLKNLIDWLSRPTKTGFNSLKGKTCYLMGGSKGISGTINPQEHLRSILGYMGVFVLPSERATIPMVYNNLNEKGELVLNEVSLGFIKQGLESLISITKAIKFNGHLTSQS